MYVSHITKPHMIVDQYEEQYWRSNQYMSSTVLYIRQLAVVLFRIANRDKPGHNKQSLTTPLRQCKNGSFSSGKSADWRQQSGRGIL
jgi:hypothetical protein